MWWFYICVLEGQYGIIWPGVREHVPDVVRWWDNSNSSEPVAMESPSSVIPTHTLPHGTESTLKPMQSGSVLTWAAPSSRKCPCLCSIWSGVGSQWLSQFSTKSKACTLPAGMLRTQSTDYSCSEGRRHFFSAKLAFHCCYLAYHFKYVVSQLKSYSYIRFRTCCFYFLCINLFHYKFLHGQLWWYETQVLKVVQHVSNGFSD